MSKITIDELIERINEVPSFPEQTNKILRMADDPETTVVDIEREILKDQGLTLKVLKMANSAFYGMSRKVDTISKATVILGFKEIKSIVITSAVGKVMKAELPAYALQKDELWKQSQGCAYAARVIAKTIRYRQPDQAYTAGLLRDVGKIIIEKYLREEFDEILKIVDKEQRPFNAVEQEVLGFSHTDIGGKLLAKWRLPEDLIEAVAYHHAPHLATTNKKLTAITHVADAIIMMTGLHLGKDGLTYELSSEALEILNLDEIMIQNIISQVGDVIASGELFVEV